MHNAVLFCRFGRLVHGLAALTLVLVLVGVIVRATGSGLGCGTAGGWHDWPLCHGQLFPPATIDAFIEYSHRLLAAVVSLSLLGAVIWTLKTPALRQRLMGGVLLALGLLVGQIVLGALTVRLLDGTQINPGFVVAHLATAFMFFATLVITGLHALQIAKANSTPAFSAHLRWYVSIVCGAVCVQLLVGGLVANLGASMACPEFPSCAGGVLIPAWDGPMGLQVLHRIGAVVVALLIMGLAWAVRRQSSLSLLAKVSVGLVALQFAMGVATVLLGLPLMARALHHVLAYVLLGAVVGIGYLVLWSPKNQASIPIGAG